MEKPKLSLTAIIAGITAVTSLLAGVFAIDSRYAKISDVNDAKTEIINEMRREVVKNRDVMIDGMRRESDDIEFQIMELERKGQTAPRYLVEKHKQILRQIEKLQEYEKSSEKPIGK